MRKILYSPGYGAGWSSWIAHNKEEQIFCCTYQPLIEAIEKKEKLFPLGEPDWEKEEDLDCIHPALKLFYYDYYKKFGRKPFLAGAKNLRIYEAHSPIKIEDFDGYESIEELYGDWF